MKNSLKPRSRLPNRSLIFLFVLMLYMLGSTKSLAYYSPASGRWLNRDRIEEAGGADLYAAVNNNITGAFDALGLETGALPVRPLPPTAPPIRILPPPGEPPPNIIQFPRPTPGLRPPSARSRPLCIVLAIVFTPTTIGPDTPLGMANIRGPLCPTPGPEVILLLVQAKYEWGAMEQQVLSLSSSNCLGSQRKRSRVHYWHALALA